MRNTFVMTSADRDLWMKLLLDAVRVSQKAILSAR